MHRFLLISNAVVALFFTAFFAWTFFGRAHIDSLARTFVTAKTQKFATPVVDLAAEALQSELALRLLTKEQIAVIKAEIGEFYAQPALYIQRLTAAKAPKKPASFSARLAEKFHDWKERIRAHYDKVLRRLFVDLRIFSGSNVAAGCIAFICTLRSRRKATTHLRLASLLLLISIGLSVYIYIDSFSFFTILFNAYLGWWYPLLLTVIFARLVLDSGTQSPGLDGGSGHRDMTAG